MMYEQTFLSAVYRKLNSFKNSRAAVIIRGLIYSPLGSCVGIIFVICGIIGILYSWWKINYWLVLSGRLAVIAEPDGDPAAGSAVIWCVIQISTVVLTITFTSCVWLIMENTISNIRDNLHKYDEENAHIDQIRS